MSHFRTVRIWNVLILLLPKTLALSVIANLKRGVFKPGFDGQFDSLTLFQHLFRFKLTSQSPQQMIQIAALSSPI